MSGHIVSLASLFLLALATSVIPGPSNFLTMRVAMRRGRGPALATALGTTLGCVIWCGAAVVGLAALLAAAPWLYKTLRIAGGIYLVWFAIALWRARPPPGGEKPPLGACLGAFWAGPGVGPPTPKPG